MRLVHFSANNTIIPIRSRRQLNSQRGVFGKPKGFWVSVEGNGDGWKNWCEDEDFGLDRLKYEHEVTLADKANILYLKTGKDIDDFTKKYRDRNSKINEALKNIGRIPDTMEIDWQEVAAQYDGIIISPYVYSRRLVGHTTWYYGWDCASGCIWNKRAIKSTKLVKTNSVDPTYLARKAESAARWSRIRVRVAAGESMPEIIKEEFPDDEE